MENYHITYLVSSKSGGYNPSVLRMLKKYVADDQIHITTSAEDIRVFSKKYSKQHNEKGILFVLGGDGALNECVNAVFGTECAVGILPMGTGNDFARGLYGKKLPSLEDLVKRSFHPTTKKIDLLQIDDTLCVNISSFGLDSMISRDSQELSVRYPWLRKYSYYICAFLNLLKNYHHNVTAMIDGVPIATPWSNMVCVIGNSSFYGSGFHILPTAKIDDGKMNVLLIEKKHKLRVLQIILKIYNGTHLKEKEVRHYFCESLHLQFTKEVLGNIDGEILSRKEIHAQIIPLALNFCQI